MNAILMLRRCGQHQADGEGASHWDLEPVQSHDREPMPKTMGEDLVPSDPGYPGVLRYSRCKGEADEQVARLNAGG